MGVVVAIIVGVVALAIGVAAVWYLLVRGSGAATVSEADFDDAYDEVVADTEGDRDAALVRLPRLGAREREGTTFVGGAHR
jgi:hypothetical protein